MTLRILLAVILTLATTSSAAFAKAAAKSSKVKKPPMQTGAKLSTDMHFDELSVHGRYQAGDEGYAVVEDEKNLDDLLDYRKDYKDRLKKSRFQR